MLLFDTLVALTVASLAVALPAAESHNDASHSAANPNANATSALDASFVPRQTPDARRHVIRTFPVYSQSTNTAYSCDTGPVQCCNSLHPSSDQKTQQLYGQALGNLLVPTDGLMVGAECNPISALGGSLGNACKSTPVCCTGNNGGGLAVGCSPIGIN